MIKEFTKEIDLLNEHNIEWSVHKISIHSSSNSNDSFYIGNYLKKTLFFNIPSGKKFLISNLHKFISYTRPEINRYFNFLINIDNNKIYSLKDLKGKVLSSGNYYLIYIQDKINESDNFLNYGNSSSGSKNEKDNYLISFKNTYNTWISKYNELKQYLFDYKILKKNPFYYISVTGELVDENL